MEPVAQDKKSVPAPHGANSGRSAAAPTRTVQLKRALRGESFATQESMLTPSHEPIQMKGNGAAPAQVHEAAAAGIQGGGGALPHGERIQAAFGRHDVSAIQAHTGPAAKAANQAMGANAYATGDHVAFGGTPDLHTAAHEAAHVVQQQHGVSLSGGVGQSGDAYERHADAVADKVVRGESAEALLDGSGGGAGGAAVQRDEPPGGSESPGLQAPKNYEGPKGGFAAEFEGGKGALAVKESGNTREITYDLLAGIADTLPHLQFFVGPVPCYVRIKPSLTLAVSEEITEKAGTIKGTVQGGGQASIGCGNPKLAFVGGGGSIAGSVSMSVTALPSGEVKAQAVQVPIEAGLFVEAGIAGAEVKMGFFKGDLGTITLGSWSSESGASGLGRQGGDVNIGGWMGTLLDVAQVASTVNEVGEWVLTPASKALKVVVGGVWNAISEGVGLSESDEDKNRRLAAEQWARVSYAEAEKERQDSYAKEAKENAQYASSGYGAMATEKNEAVAEHESPERKAARSMGGQVQTALGQVGPAANVCNSKGGKHTPAAAALYNQAFAKNTLAKEAAAQYVAMLSANEANPGSDVHPSAAVMAQAQKAIQLAHDAVALFVQGDRAHGGGGAGGPPVQQKADAQSFHDATAEEPAQTEVLGD